MKKRLEDLDWETAPDSLTVGGASSLLRIPRNAAYEAATTRSFCTAVNFGKRRTRISKLALQKVFGATPRAEHPRPPPSTTFQEA